MADTEKQEPKIAPVKDDRGPACFATSFNTLGKQNRPGPKQHGEQATHLALGKDPLQNHNGEIKMRVPANKRRLD
jgi:hypothetical protein